MGILATDKNQLTIIYYAKSETAKRTLGYLEGTEKKVQKIDISRTNLGDTIWIELSDNLNCSVKDLMSLDGLEFKALREAEMSENDWLKVLNKNPSVLRNPIVVNGMHYKQITVPFEVMEFFNVDSSGLKKKFIGDLSKSAPGTDTEQFLK